MSVELQIGTEDDFADDATSEVSIDTVVAPGGPSNTARDASNDNDNSNSGTNAIPAAALDEPERLSPAQMERRRHVVTLFASMTQLVILFGASVVAAMVGASVHFIVLATVFTVLVLPFIINKIASRLVGGRHRHNSAKVMSRMFFVTTALLCAACGFGVAWHRQTDYPDFDIFSTDTAESVAFLDKALDQHGGYTVTLDESLELNLTQAAAFHIEVVGQKNTRYCCYVPIMKGDSKSVYLFGFECSLECDDPEKLWSQEKQDLRRGLHFSWLYNNEGDAVRSQIMQRGIETGDSMQLVWIGEPQEKQRHRIQIIASLSVAAFVMALLINAASWPWSCTSRWRA
ncbi:MAG: hypothetical protein MHM6MM_007435 [Cercozoa sp. M6MM]